MTEQEEFEFRHRLERERAPSGKPAPMNVNPTEGNSFAQNAAAGLGKSMVDLGRGASQVVRGLGPQFNASADFFGLPNQADVDESRRLDAPLMATGGGKVGKFGGDVLSVAATGGLGGSIPTAAAVGGGIGLLQPTATGESRALNTVLGAAGGAGGQAVANKIGATILNRTAQNAPKLNVAKDANAAGYVIPPEDIGGGALTRAASGLSGKIKTAQEASARNQPITNDLVKAEFGLTQNAALDIPALAGVRAKAGQAYDAVSNTGTITAPKSYETALDAIVAPYKQAAKGFPNAKPNPIIAEIESLRSPQFDASSAVSKIKELRAGADTAYANGNKEMGKALKSGADAIEDAIDSHLVSTGVPGDLLKNFREARQTIAKTYTAQKALNATTGDINAQTLAKELQKGKPLSGNLLAVAEAANTFPKALQALKEAPKSLSPLDFAVAGLGLSGSDGNPLAAAGLLARPAARSVLLSGPMQRNMLAQKPSALARLLSHEEVTVPAGVLSGNALAAYLGQQ